MNKRHYEHTLPNIRGSLSNTYFCVSFVFYCITKEIKDSRNIRIRKNSTPKEIGNKEIGGENNDKKEDDKELPP